MVVIGCRRDGLPTFVCVYMTSENSLSFKRTGMLMFFIQSCRALFKKINKMLCTDKSFIINTATFHKKKNHPFDVIKTLVIAVV